MSDKIFVHYPPCASRKYEDAWDALIRTHSHISIFRDRVEIFSTPHAVRQMQGITPIQEKHSAQSYLFYSLLYLCTKFALPPSPARLRARPLWREDRFKLRYHTKELDLCATGIFVPHNDGTWPYDMWRNARRMLQQGKPVWLILGNTEAGWRIAPLKSAPIRAQRLNRKVTLAGIGLYTEPIIYPSLFSMLADAWKARNK